MSITFQWAVKHIASDSRGYGHTGHFEMSGADENGNLKIDNVVVSFGGDDYKPISAWQQADIDAYAETHRQYLERSITEKFNSPPV